MHALTVRMVFWHYAVLSCQDWQNVHAYSSLDLQAPPIQKDELGT